MKNHRLGRWVPFYGFQSVEDIKCPKQGTTLYRELAGGEVCSRHVPFSLLEGKGLVS